MSLWIYPTLLTIFAQLKHFPLCSHSFLLYLNLKLWVEIRNNTLLQRSWGHCSESSGFQLARFCLLSSTLRHTNQCLETFLMITTWGEGVASGTYWIEASAKSQTRLKWLSMHACRWTSYEHRKPSKQKRTIWPKMSVVLSLRNTDWEDNHQLPYKACWMSLSRTIPVL